MIIYLEEKMKRLLVQVIGESRSNIFMPLNTCQEVQTALFDLVSCWKATLTIAAPLTIPKINTFITGT